MAAITDALLLTILAFLNIPVYRSAFRVIFGSWENLTDASEEATRNQRDLFWAWTASWNDMYNNNMATVFLAMFAAICIGAVLGEYYVMVRVVLHRAPFWS